MSDRGTAASAYTIKSVWLRSTTERGRVKTLCVYRERGGRERPTAISLSFYIGCTVVHHLCPASVPYPKANVTKTQAPALSILGFPLPPPPSPLTSPLGEAFSKVRQLLASHTFLAPTVVGLQVSNCHEDVEQSFYSRRSPIRSGCGQTK